jgi:hypothetical protein
VVELNIRISKYWSSLKKQTDGTRRRKLRANPDVERRFSKNNHALNIPYMTTSQGPLSLALKLSLPNSLTSHVGSVTIL